MNDDPSLIRSEFAGDAEIGEIIVLYAEEMPDRAARLQAELDAGNIEQLLEISHQIKGSAGSHGFPTISKAAAQLNDRIKTAASQEEIVKATITLIDMCRRTTGEAES